MKLLSPGPRIPHVQYPSCCGNKLLNLTLQSLVTSSPNAGYSFTSVTVPLGPSSSEVHDHWQSLITEFAVHFSNNDSPTAALMFCGTSENPSFCPKKK